MAERYDCIVVGSGFGGGVAACRLAEAGMSVLVLERGKRFAPGDFPSEPHQAPSLLWHKRLNPGGMFELGLHKGVNVLTAAGVGGGSLVYANVQLRAPADVFEHGWPSGLSRAELDPYYERTEEALMPVTTPTDPALPKIASFDAAAELAGRDSRLLPLAVYFGEDRRHPFSGVAQQGCTNLGRCDLGCPRAAKNTIDITYLARAEAYGAAVRPLHEVETLTPPATGGNGAWKVGFSDLHSRTRGSAESRFVVLAAGAIGSPRLLLKQRKRLPGISPALGTKFSGNGDALAAAFDPKNDAVAGAHTDFGPVMTSMIDYTADRRAIVADGSLPTNFGGVLALVRGLTGLTGWGRLALRVKLAAARAGLRVRPPVPHRVNRANRKAPISDSLVFLMIGRDAADGRMRLTWLLKRFQVVWKDQASRRLFDDMRTTAAELGAAAEADAFYARDAGPLGKYVTVHPLGGCPMADDPVDGVVDEFGRVHGFDGLFVLDGSIVPTALGVNPSKTIAALAERGIEKLIESV